MKFTGPCATTCRFPWAAAGDKQYDFEFGDFLHRYRFSAMMAHSSLQILSREGYIVLTDAFYNPSRIKFHVERDELYTFQVKNADFDGFIKLLLRSYSGLFSQFVKIDESSLSRRSGLSQEKVYSYLKTLSKRQIIHYLPRKEIPVLTFLEERLDDKNLLIAQDRYNFRKERYEKRIREMLRYASSETHLQEPVSAQLLWTARHPSLRTLRCLPERWSPTTWQ